MDRLALPWNLVVQAEHQGWHAWLATLPGTVAGLAARWSLEVGPPFQPGGQTSWVAPVRTGGGGEAVLKVCWSHPEAVDEAAGLLAWDGDGAVRCYESADVEGGTALLLERCRPGATLRTTPEPDQDVIVAGLLNRLWRRSPPNRSWRTLGQMSVEWTEVYHHQRCDRPAAVDSGVEREAMALWRELPATAPHELLLCTDLHAGNVLAAGRERWLVIDPKPHVGDPTYDVLQHLLNCQARLRADPVGLARRVAGLAGLDADRVLAWLLARCVQQSLDWPWLADVVRLLTP